MVVGVDANPRTLAAAASARRARSPRYTADSPSDANTVDRPPNRVGALTSVRGPYESSNTTLFTWLVQVDPERAQRLASRCFGELTGGDVTVDPVGSLAMLSVGEIGSVSSLASGFDRLGQLSEKQVVVWLPSRVRWRSPARGPTHRTSPCSCRSCGSTTRCR